MIKTVWAEDHFLFLKSKEGRKIRW